MNSSLQQLSRISDEILDQLIGDRNPPELFHCDELFVDLKRRFAERLLAAIDGLVHCASIFELNSENYRRRTAVQTKRGRGRIAFQATPANTKVKLTGSNSSKNQQAQVIHR